MTTPIPPPAKTARPPLTGPRRLVLGIAAALAMLLMVEGTIRVVKTVGDDIRSRHQKWYRIDPTLGWIACPNFKGRAFEARRAFDADGFLAADAPKLRDGRPKVAVLGDSNAFGYKLETPDTYCEQLGAMLPEAGVINLGVVGYTSYQGLKQLETTALKLRPAALIVSYNYNDRRYVITPDQVDGAEYFQRVARASRIRQINRDLYILRLLGGLTGQEGLFDNPEEDWNLDYYRTAQTGVCIEQMPPRVSPKQYRENLTRIARLASAQGIPVIFLALRDNPATAQFLYDSARLRAEGKTAEAIEKLKQNSDGKNYFSLLARRRLAALYRQSGQPGEAERIARIDYPIFSLNGGTPLELDTDYNQIMREVARATGQQVVDAGALTAQKPELYLDYCHLNAAGHKLIAERLRDPVRQALGKKEE